MENNETVLVTGGTGFVGLRIILQLLQQGYAVRTTMRSLKSKDRILETLKANGISDFEKLSFAETELTQDANWAEAMQSCSCVLSVASPVFFETPKNADEAIRPAVEGILRILRFAEAASVRRVVMTSNFGAVGFSQRDKTRETTEKDWTDTDMKGLSVYERSKTLAEKAAWNHINNTGSRLEFTTINPVAILGPSLDEHVSGSFHLLEALLSGSMKAVPDIPLNVVDVRDVADLHIRAMTTPGAAGKRFIATADGQTSLPEIAALLKEKRPEVSGNVSGRTLPNGIIRIGALFSRQAKEALVLMKMNRNVSNAQAKNILGWRPLATNEEAVLAAVDSMIQYNLLHRK